MNLFLCMQLARRFSVAATKPLGDSDWTKTAWIQEEKNKLHNSSEEQAAAKLITTSTRKPFDDRNRVVHAAVAAVQGGRGRAVIGRKGRPILKTTVRGRFPRPAGRPAGGSQGGAGRLCGA